MRHLKTPPERREFRVGRGRGPLGICALAACTALGLLLLAASASAQTSPFPVAGAPCPNEAIREEQGAQFLPDCRAYEQVSPTAKFGYQIGNNEYPSSQLSIAPDGESATYATLYPVNGTSGSKSGSLARRTASGWTNTGLTFLGGFKQDAPSLPGNDVSMRGSTPDERASVYWDNTTEPFGSLWLVRADGTHQMIAMGTGAGGTGGQRPNGQGSGELWQAGMSTDGRHVVFSSDARIGPAAGLPGSENILYEWVDDGGNGTLRVVSRTDDPALTLIDESAPAELGGATVSTEARNADPDSGNSTSAQQHAISADGRRIFFQAPASEAGYVSAFSPLVPLGGGPVYARQDGKETIELSAPAPGYAPVSPPTLFQYLDASVDGSVAFFWANGDLVPGAPAGGGIYSYRLGTNALTFLAPTTSVKRPPTAMASDDGTHLYYQDETGIYLGVGGETRTVLAGAITASGPPITSHTPSINANWGGLHADRCTSATVSPNGRFLAFSAINGGGTPLEVYRYDATNGTVSRLSTSPTAPGGSESGFAYAGACAQEYPRPIEARAMSDDGRFVFFSTATALVPEDSNGRFDVYRWRADDGSVALLSPGTGPGDTFFAGTDATGANAMIYSEEALAPSDGDAVYDLYDVRVDGGFAAATTPGCQGSACQGPPQPSPPLSAPASSALRGPNDVRERRQARKRAEAKRRHAKQRRHAKRRAAKQRRRHHKSSSATSRASQGGAVR